MCCSTTCENKCGNQSVPAQVQPEIYWHRELPPITAEVLGEHSLEATGKRTPGTLTHRGELWDECYDDLMGEAARRLKQETVRLGGNCAHVTSESVDSHHDGPSNESWLSGRFSSVLYRNLMKP